MTAAGRPHLRRLVLGGLLALIAVGAPAVEAPVDDPVIARVLGREVRASQRGRLNSLIFGGLLDGYRTKHGLEATAEEIEQFIVRTAEHQAKMRQEWRATRAGLETKLADEGLDAAEEERLATLRQLLTPDPEMERWRREHVAENRAIEEQAARQTIDAWKVSKALFEEYGGRVIFQQAGPEPLDAYREFLEEHAAAGSFELLDAEAEKEFWRYFVDDRMHAFMDIDGAEIFATPWWLRDRPLGEPAPTEPASGRP